MAFLRTLVIALIIHVRTDFYHQLKAIRNTTFRWSHREKSNCLVEMNICALRLIIGEHDPVDFIFT